MSLFLQGDLQETVFGSAMVIDCCQFLTSVFFSVHFCQAHDSAVRTMEWSHNDTWLLSADHSGTVKYWQSNMNNVKTLQAHTDPVRGVGYVLPSCNRANHFLAKPKSVLKRATFTNLGSNHI